MRKHLILLCGLFCFFSDDSMSAAAAVPAEGEVEEPAIKLTAVQKWQKLATAVEKHTAPFNLGPTYITATNTQEFIGKIKHVLQKHTEGAFAAPDAAETIRKYLEVYISNEPNKYTYYKGTTTVKYAAEMFSMSVDPSLSILFGEKAKHVGRSKIYTTVEKVVGNLADDLAKRIGGEFAAANA